MLNYIHIAHQVNGSVDHIIEIYTVKLIGRKAARLVLKTPNNLYCTIFIQVAISIIARQRIAFMIGRNAEGVLIGCYPCKL